MLIWKSSSTYCFECFLSIPVICAGITDDQAMGSDGEDDLPVLKRIEADLKSSTNTDISSPDGKQVDLFSEIHLNELKKLEKQLEQVRISSVETVTLRSIY
jgi:Microtubule-associated protein Bicaudal-D.